jgi:hypothetical protein
MLRDIGSVRGIGLPHLVSLAGREGEWLGDWVAEYRESPEVHAALAAERVAATTIGITEAPSILVADAVYEPASMPDDIADRVAAQVDSFA